MKREPARVRSDGRSRAQTTQDFAVGIGIFILAIAFVISQMPALITPFVSSTASESAQADRIAATIIENTSTETTNELEMSAFDTLQTSDLGTRETIDNVNITIENFEGNETHSPPTGSTYTDESTGTATRLVTVDDDSNVECDPACRLIVRVW